MDDHAVPPWLVTEPEPYVEFDLGPLKTGKEAEVFLLERIATNDPTRRCLLAHKRYRPRRVTNKGELELLGFQRASNFVHDQQYREGRELGNSRDRRAVARKSTYGRSVLGRSWPDHELEVLARLHRAGVTVPYPVERTTDGFLMQYVGDRTKAAPRLVQARLERAQVEQARDQLVADLRRMMGEGMVATSPTSARGSPPRACPSTPTPSSSTSCTSKRRSAPIVSDHVGLRDPRS